MFLSAKKQQGNKTPIKFQYQDFNKTMGTLNLVYVQASFAYVKKP
jgi:hypothetical protein